MNTLINSLSNLNIIELDQNIIDCINNDLINIAFNFVHKNNFILENDPKFDNIIDKYNVNLILSYLQNNNNGYHLLRHYICLAIVKYDINMIVNEKMIEEYYMNYINILRLLLD